MDLLNLSVQIEKSTVQRVVGSGDKRCLIRAEVESQHGNFAGFRHAADGLRSSELCKCFGFLAWEVLLDETIDKWRMDARRRNGVAADIMVQIITRNGVRHASYRAFAHGIRISVFETSAGGDGSHVDNHAATLRHHCSDRLLHGVVCSQDIYAKDPFKIFVTRVLKAAHMRHSGT